MDLRLAACLIVILNTYENNFLLVFNLVFSYNFK